MVNRIRWALAMVNCVRRLLTGALPPDRLEDELRRLDTRYGVAWHRF